MTTLTIAATTAALFTPELRAQLLNDISSPNPAGVFSVGDTLHVEGDSDEDIRSALTPHAWVFPEGAEDVSCHNLYHAPPRVQRQAAAAYFAAWGNAGWNNAVDAKLLELAEHKEGEPSFDVLCLSFGMLVLSTNPVLDMCLDAQNQDEERITQDIVDANIALVLDASASAHEGVEALARVQAFIDTMFTKTLAARNDRERWDAFYEGISLKVAGPRAS